MRHFWGNAAALLCVALAATSAHADPSPQDRAAAQSFFDKALATMKDGKFEAACPMLEESQRLDPGMGTQFQLAKCYEGAGRVASAWIQYVDVAEAAKAAGQADKEKVARQHADAVRARVPKLVIEVAPANGDAIEVKRDGAPMRKIQWGSEVPVDPGKHTISATAAGKKPFDTTVDVKEGGTAKVTVPELARETAATPPPPATTSAGAPPLPPPTSTSPPASGGLGTQKTLALVAGGAGVIALGAGVFLGLSAKSKQNDAGANCVGDRCNQTGIDARSDAVKTGTLGTIVGGIGLLALAGGATLWFTAPKVGEATAIRVSPTLSGVTMGGSF